MAMDNSHDSEPPSQAALDTAKKKLNQAFSSQKDGTQSEETVSKKSKDPLVDVFRSIFPDMKEGLDTAMELIRNTNLNDVASTEVRVNRAYRHLSTLKSSIEIASRFLPFLKSGD